MKEVKNSIKTKSKVKILVFFFLNFAILIVLATVYFKNDIEERKERYYYIGENQANVIEDQFELVVSKLEIIENIIYTNRNTDSFDDIAKKIYDDTNTESNFNVVCISIAPDGIVEKVYPKEGNEVLINSNLLDPSLSGNQSVIEAYNKGSIAITDFFILSQGTEGLAIRKPIVIDGSTWGLVSIAIEKEGFDEQLNLNNLEEMGLYYKLRYYLNDEEVILSKNTDKDLDFVNVTINYQNLKWIISVCPTDGWLAPIKVIGIVVVLFLIALLVTCLLGSTITLNEANKKLYDLANIDPLSQCYTRNYIRTHLIDIQTGDWKNINGHYSLVYIDIDYFKNINDVYGHHIGDAIIESVSTVIRNELTECDLVSRFGGDEFVIFFKDITKEELIKRIENIIENVKALDVENQTNIHITLSMGVAFYDEEPSHKYKDLLESADKKLYISKSKGKNQYTI